MSSETQNLPLAPATQERVAATRLGIALDWWAVIAAIALAVLVRFNLLPAINWFK
ncbi:MAG: hypothetical protein ABSH22_08530 [Tepidisphaeraceae bacterium]|jgi:hypothetical protein